MQTPLRLLARFKRLRGTAFDLFGYTEERRMERELIGWYEGIVETMLTMLPTQGPAALVDLAKAPMDIRGYGPVKDAAVKTVKAEVERLWQRVAEATVSEIRANRVHAGQ